MEKDQSLELFYNSCAVLQLSCYQVKCACFRQFAGVSCFPCFPVVHRLRIVSLINDQTSCINGLLIRNPATP